MSKTIAQQVISERIPSGMDVVVIPTRTKDLVIANLALNLGAYETYDRRTIALLLSIMLPSGVEGKTRATVRDTFDLLGADVSIHVSNTHLYASLTSCTASFNDAFALLMRVIATPRNTEHEFSEAVARAKTILEHEHEDTHAQAECVLIQTQYRKGHPHWSPTLQSLQRELRTARLSEVRAFHEAITTSVGGLVVIGGDVVPDKLLPHVRKACAVIPDHVFVSQRKLHPEYVTGATGDYIVSMADKMNVDTLLGIPLSITRDHTDYEALGVAVDILGGSSSSRLFNELRTRQSLTYGSYASCDGFTEGYPGFLRAYAIFPNDVFMKGRTALREVIESFVDRGVTAQELSKRKEELIGKRTVALSTTRNVVGALFDTVLSGKPAEFLDEYPERIRALSLRDVNAAIHTHIDMGHAVTVAAGGIREDGTVIS